MMMRLLLTTALAIATANAAFVELNNHCTTSLWVVIATEAVPQPQSWELKSGVAWKDVIVGKGNDFGVSLDKLYYSNVPKLVLGTSLDQGRVWWSVNSVSGVAFADGEFNVTSPEPCGSTSTYDQLVHNCPDGDFTVTLDVCV